MAEQEGDAPETKETTETQEDEEVKLDWKDYIAIGIALLQTVLLPIVIFIAIMISIVLIARL